MKINAIGEEQEVGPHFSLCLTRNQQRQRL